MTFDQETAHALYKRLLALYPRAFRERLGESMQQTFNDLYNERKLQTQQGLFSFVLWTFIETAIGIVQEHILLTKEMNPMENTLTSLRLPAIISFLIILPFMLLEFMSVMVRGLNFDRRDALDSIVVFGFLWLGVAAILIILMPLVRDRRAANNVTANPVPAQGRTILTNPTSAAMLSLLLALPFVAILSLLLFHIRPPLGPLEPLLINPDPDQPNVLGSLIVLGAFLLAVAACLIARAPIVRTMRAGGGLLAHPINLILAVVILSFTTKLVVGIMVDQYPCWIGVPNCDWLQFSLGRVSEGISIELRYLRTFRREVPIHAGLAGKTSFPCWAHVRGSALPSCQAPTFGGIWVGRWSGGSREFLTASMVFPMEGMIPRNASEPPSTTVLLSTRTLNSPYRPWIMSTCAPSSRLILAATRAA